MTAVTEVPTTIEDWELLNNRYLAATSRPLPGGTIPSGSAARYHRPSRSSATRSACPASNG
jgi:hypothetical protein